MLTKRIIPCLDVKDGRVVKGVQFVALVDAGDPVEVAAAYDAQGADELCFLDINASHENRGTMLDLVARTADRLTIPFSVGGRASPRASITRALVSSYSIVPGWLRRARRSAIARSSPRFPSVPSSRIAERRTARTMSASFSAAERSQNRIVSGLTMCMRSFSMTAKFRR